MDYLGLLIHAALLLRRYENAIIREVVDPLFEALTKEIAVASRASLLNFDRQRIQKVLDLVYARLGERAGKDVVLVAENHARKVEQAIERRAPRTRDPRPAAELKRSAPLPGLQSFAAGSRAQEILDGDSFDGATWKRWNEIERERTARQTHIHTQLSRNAKETPAELRARLQKFVVQPAMRRARALTRTFSLNVANALSWEAAEQDPRVRGYRLLVTLDSKTSLVCINYAAEHKFYLLVPGNPRPPFHYSCRTILFLVIEGHEKKKPPEPEAWLNKKTPEQQNEILGEERAALWRSGEISLSELIRSDNTVKSLAELRGVSSSSGIR